MFLRHSDTKALGKNIANVYPDLEKGHLNENLKLSETSTDSSLEELNESVNTLITSLIKTEKYALEIEKGNLNAEFSALGKNDRLGNALIKMGQSIRKAHQQEEERYHEEERRRWTSDGLATFSLLFRDNSEDFHKYCHKIIS